MCSVRVSLFILTRRERMLIFVFHSPVAGKSVICGREVYCRWICNGTRAIYACIITRRHDTRRADSGLAVSLRFAYALSLV